MRASKVGLLGLAIAAAFAAGAIAAPPQNNAIESSQPHVASTIVLSRDATRNVADVQGDIRAILEPTLADRWAVVNMLERIGEFVVSYKQGAAHGQLPEFTREEMLEMKPGVLLHDAGVAEVDKAAILALVDEWIDIKPVVDARMQVRP